MTFVTKSPDPDSVLTNLSELLVGDAIALQVPSYLGPYLGPYLGSYLGPYLGPISPATVHPPLTPPLFSPPLPPPVACPRVRQQQQLQSGEALTTTPHVLVTCSVRDRLR